MPRQPRRRRQQNADKLAAAGQLTAAILRIIDTLIHLMTR